MNWRDPFRRPPSGLEPPTDGPEPDPDPDPFPEIVLLPPPDDEPAPPPPDAEPEDPWLEAEPAPASWLRSTTSLPPHAPTAQTMTGTNASVAGVAPLIKVGLIKDRT